MTKRTYTQLDSLVRELDPAPPTVTEDERHRAVATRDRIMAMPIDGRETVLPPRGKQRRARAVAAVALVATAAVALPALVGGSSAFASWTASPTPLSPSQSTGAAASCRSTLGVDDQRARPVISEMRGDWTYVVIESPAGEGACLMRGRHVSRDEGFFGTYQRETTPTPTPAADAIDETQSMGGSVTIPGRLGLGSSEAWFTWVSGYVGSDVVGVTVHPPVGPDVEATVVRGRFGAWWPAGDARGDNPGVGGAWTYTVTLADGTTRQPTA